jgi:hypothetical protein
MARKLHRSKQMAPTDNRRVLVRLQSGMTIIVGTTADMHKEVGIAVPEGLEGVVIEGNKLVPPTGINVALAHQDDRYVLYKEIA